jgi:malonyl-CoA/methylmalonyl-CoA synthetase
MEGNLFQVLRERSTDRLSKVFLREPEGRSLTYSECFRMSGQYAQALQECGVKEGDRVLVKVEKSIDAVALYLACLQFGVIYVPLNPVSTLDETNYFIADAEPSLVVFSDGDTMDVPVHSETIGGGSGSLNRIASSLPALDIVTKRADSDVAAMLYTSGTTGKPKGAMLTHRGLIENARALHETWGFRSDDVLLHCLPIFHVHGLFVALHCAMLSAAEVIFLQRFTVSSVIDALPQATVMMGVPTHYVRLLEDENFDHALCHHMRLFISGSAPMSQHIHKAFNDVTGQQILERYGMTEAGIITSNPLHGERIPGTVGFALPEMDLRITKGDTVCASGETGTVEIRGDHLFSGYWRQADQTAESFRDDGFFITGDIGSLDNQGRLSLEGRAHDMIISGGENIYPKEIELHLDELESIKESAIVGLPHPDLGEAVTAFIVTKGIFSEAEIRDHLTTHIASFKQPKKYVIVDELPRNSMGKIQKNRLREEYSSLFSSH